MSSLVGHSILVVEDEALVAMDVQVCLQREGAYVVCAGSAAEAVRLADRPGLSAAIIDYDLGDENGESVCDRLAKRSVPFLFYSGWDANYLHDRWNSVPILSKPVSPEELVSALQGLLGSASVTGVAS